MKLKRLMMCAALAVGMALTAGCGNNDDPNGPREIEGFTGNVEDVSPKAGDLIATFEFENFGTIKAVLFPEAAPVGVDNFRKLCDEGYYEGLTVHRVMKDFMFQGGSLNGDGMGGDALVNGGSFGIETAQNARHFYGALCYANAGGQNSTQFYIVNDKTPTDTAEVAANYSALAGQYRDYAQQLKDAGMADYADDYGSYADNLNVTVEWMNAATEDIKKRYNEKGGAASLDGGYTVFGQVYEGFDVIDSISAVEVRFVDESNPQSELSVPVEPIIIKNVYVSEYVEG